MRVERHVTFDRASKTYTVTIENYWGRCRAGGSYNGWFTMDKIPVGSKVRFIEEQPTVVDDKSKLLSWNKHPEETKVEKIEVNRCLRIFPNKTQTYKTKTEFVEAMKSKLYLEECRTFSESVDFSKSLLVGVNVSASYCNPYEKFYVSLQEFSASKVLVVNNVFSHNLEVCAGVMHYDSWIKVPRKYAEFTLKVKKRSLENRKSFFRKPKPRKVN